MSDARDVGGFIRGRSAPVVALTVFAIALALNAALEAARFGAHLRVIFVSVAAGGAAALAVYTFIKIGERRTATNSR